MKPKPELDELSRLKEELQLVKSQLRAERNLVSASSYVLVVKLKNNDKLILNYFDDYGLALQQGELGAGKGNQFQVIGVKNKWRTCYGPERNKQSKQ